MNEHQAVTDREEDPGKDGEMQLRRHWRYMPDIEKKFKRPRTMQDRRTDEESGTTDRTISNSEPK